MRYDSSFNNALAGFYRSAAIVSAVTFSAFCSLPVSAAIDDFNNYFYDAPSKTWIPTRDAVITPKGTVINNSAANQAQRFLDGNGGFSNKSKITANFPKVNKSVPVTINARVTPTAVKSAAKKVLKGGAATLVIGAGLDALLDGLDWVMDEGSRAQKKSDYISQGGAPVADVAHCPGYGATTYNGCKSYILANRPDLSIGPLQILSNSIGLYYWAGIYKGSSQAAEWKTAAYPGSVTATEYLELPDSDIDQAVDSNYSPTLDDYPVLAPYLPPQSTLLDPIPRVTEPATTVTVTDLDTGETTTTEINIWHDFDITDNPSTKPKVDVKTTEETKTYKDGQLTKTSTKTETSPADTDQPSAGGAVPPPESPIDCDLFPTACAWMEWTQEPPEEPDDDLSKLLKEVPVVSETFTITGGAAACPAPLVLNLSQFGATEVSYQPLCDLASTMKFLYLALMSLLAAILLHRSISRV